MASKPPPACQLPPGIADDWRLPFDLPCPICRYNLRMLRLPRCPECGGVFRWQAILNVCCPRCGERLTEESGEDCPRCALPLDWQKLFEAATPEGNEHLYEYTHRPARRMFQTWRRVLLPKTFWRTVAIELAPNVARLRWYRGVALALAGLVLLVPLLIGAYRSAGVRRYWNMDLFYGSVNGWVAVWMLGNLLPLVTAFALPFFVPTLSRFRVRGDQLLRCTAYGLTALAWSAGVLALGWLAILIGTWCLPPLATRGGFVLIRVAGFDLDDLFDWLIYGWRPPASLYALPLLLNVMVLAVLALVGLAWWWRYLFVTLRCYLKLDRGNAWALFVSTQLIGLLILAIAWTSWAPIARIVGRWIIRIAG